MDQDNEEFIEEYNEEEYYEEHECRNIYSSMNKIVNYLEEMKEGIEDGSIQVFPKIEYFQFMNMMYGEICKKCPSFSTFESGHISTTLWECMTPEQRKVFDESENIVCYSDILPYLKRLNGYIKYRNNLNLPILSPIDQLGFDYIPIVESWQDMSQENKKAWKEHGDDLW